MAAQVPRRVLLDVEEIQQQSYQDQGIFYCPDEQNLFVGTLLIWGPKDSIYEDMPMMYNVHFPTNYPFEPPKVLFQTTDHKTRFHPNMYVCGKVCLSILGTWEGPKWTGTLRLSSVALTLQSLMDTNPIAHEPGFSGRTDSYAKGYNEFVGYKCLEYLVRFLDQASKNISSMTYPLPIFQEQIQERLLEIAGRVATRLQSFPESQWSRLPYQLSGETDIPLLKTIFERARAKIEQVSSEDSK